MTPISNKKEVHTRGAVLVTGGAGYIGSHTCKALSQAGYLPVTYDNLVHGHRWAVQWGPMIEADLADAERLKEAFKTYSIKAVIHFAGYAYVGESMTQPGKYFRNNAANTLTLLEAMQAAGADKIVFSSSCATYGMPSEMPMSENNRQEPINPYGESKLFIEKMLRWWGVAHGLRSMPLRYFNAAGSDPEGQIGEDHQPETHLIPLAVQAALGTRSHLEIFGTDYETRDGTAIRDYIHVTDLAAAHLKALRKLEEQVQNRALNLGTGRGHSVREVVAMVERVSGRKVPIKHASRRPGDPPELVARVERAREVLGWEPQHSSLQTIIETAWQWHSSHHAAVSKPGSALHPDGVTPTSAAASRA